MKIALVQLNPIVGDISGNLKLAGEAIAKCLAGKPDAIAFTELFLTGYPPRDLLHRTELVAENEAARDFLIKLTATFEPALIFGYAENNPADGEKPLFNSVCVAQGGKVLQTRHKALLPTYDVFEERRYFQPGTLENIVPVEINGEKIGIVICEEAWNAKNFWPKREYPIDPVEIMVTKGATYILSINASPFRIEEDKPVSITRQEMVIDHCKRLNVGFAYVNQWGANDEIIFDGASFSVDANGTIDRVAMNFDEDIIWVDTKAVAGGSKVYVTPVNDLYLQGLTLGISDYFGKQTFFKDKKAMVAVSGGIDSAIVAYLAVRALGKDRVIGVSLPSEYSSDGSKSDAQLLCDTLGIKMITVPISTIHNAFRNCLDFGLMQLKEKGPKIVDSGVTDENLQARARGTIMMGYCNYYNAILLTTGNKSELAVGYCTIYGDMCGGLAVIADVYKTKVFELCRHINEQSNTEIIPWNTINKPPSAELKPGQVDQQSLPPYPVLDEILTRFVDKEQGTKQIIKAMVSVDAEVAYRRETAQYGIPRDLTTDIRWVSNKVIGNEYKRKQAPPGLKVSRKHFKYGWHMPIVYRLTV